MDCRTFLPRRGALHRPGARAAVAAAGLALLAMLALAGCTAGGGRYAAEAPAGFWAGLWHGLIVVFTFVVSLFNDGVAVYEPFNKGGLYDLGFLLGVACFFGGSGSAKSRSRARKARDREWEDVGDKVEQKIRRGIESWLEESGQEDKEWAELGEKIQEKIKRELRKWAEK
ncbi:MAG: hypothetical protein V3S29_12240 [bacterium]